MFIYKKRKKKVGGSERKREGRGLKKKTGYFQGGWDGRRSRGGGRGRKVVEEVGGDREGGME